MKRLALIFRLAFAWNKKARTAVRRSVGAKYAKRKPKVSHIPPRPLPPRST